LASEAIRLAPFNTIVRQKCALRILPHLWGNSCNADSKSKPYNRTSNFAQLTQLDANHEAWTQT